MKKPFNLQKTTEEEREKLTELLSEMMKDIVYANAHMRAEQVIHHMFRVTEIKDTDNFNITYNVNIGGGTIRATLGKIRRKKEKT